MLARETRGSWQWWMDGWSSEKGRAPLENRLYVSIEMITTCRDERRVERASLPRRREEGDERERDRNRPGEQGAGEEKTEQGGEHTASVQSHAAGAGELVALNALLLDDLLGDDIAGREEHRRGDALREQRPGRQFALVPTRGVPVSPSALPVPASQARGGGGGRRASPTKHAGRYRALCTGFRPWAEGRSLGFGGLGCSQRPGSCLPGKR